MKRFRMDKKGVGGFIEAAVSMIIVTTAVAVLFSALLFHAAADGSRPDDTHLQQGLNALESALKGDRALWVEDGVLSIDGLRAMHPEHLAVASTQGYAIILGSVTPGNEFLIKIASGHPDQVDLIESRSIPMNACSESDRIYACLLTLVVW